MLTADPSDIAPDLIGLFVMGSLREYCRKWSQVLVSVKNLTKLGLPKAVRLVGHHST
jgi:hypothetical protein